MYSSSEYNSELLRSVLRYFALAMVSMGVYTLLSGGVNVVSSIMVIALGYQWLCAAASRGSLQTHLHELSLLSDKDCRGCCRNCCSGMCRGTFDNIRGLAIAAITFGVLEILFYSFSFSILGLLYTNYSYYYGGYYNNVNVETSSFSCYTGGSSYCYINYSPAFQSSYQSYSIPCYSGSSYYCYVTLPNRIYGYSSSFDSFSDYYSGVGSFTLWDTLRLRHLSILHGELSHST